MSFFVFDEDDLFVNTIQAYPEYSFYIQNNIIYIDNTNLNVNGKISKNIHGVPQNYISLYQYNIDRNGTTVPFIRPFVYKNSDYHAFSTSNTSSYFANPWLTDEGESTQIFGSYNMSSSITRRYYAAVPSGSSHGVDSFLKALKNSFKHYRILSPHYSYTIDNASVGWSSGDPIINLENKNTNLIMIPSVFYGSSIKKGSVNLRFYYRGELIGHLVDRNKNGELIQVAPEGSTGSGSVAGVALYNEGVLVLTGSWDLDSTSGGFGGSGNRPNWTYFAQGANDGLNAAAGDFGSNQFNSPYSYQIDYSGSNQVQTLTMLAHAKYGELNHSNNPTFLSSSNVDYIISGSYKYAETPKTIKNVVKSQFTDEEPDFEKTVYITKVGIYDEHRNLIGIAKLANPVRKTVGHQYTFKLKLDI